MSDNKRTGNSDGNRQNGLVNRLRDDKAFAAKVSIGAVALLLCVVIVIAIVTGRNPKDETKVEAGAQVSAEGGEETDRGNTDSEDTGDSAAAGEEQTDNGQNTESSTKSENPTDQVNEMLDRYFAAMASGDTDTITSLKGEMEEKEALQIQKKSNYISSIENLNVVYKDGPEADSYIAFVYYEILFKDIETAAPGLTTFYICKNQDGQYQICDGELDESVTAFIKEAASAEDVAEIFDRVQVKYNEATEKDEALKTFMEKLPDTLEKEVAQAMDETKKEETAETASEETPADESTVKTEQVTATDTVNVRSSDSETADKVGQIEEGTTITRYEARQNGWSRVDYNGQEAYIKSEYLKAEAQESTATNTEGETTEKTEEAPAKAEAPASDSDLELVKGKIVVVETVNVRKSAGEQAERIGTAFEGEYYDLIMEQADGWTKINFNGQTGYVKSEYVKHG